MNLNTDFSSLSVGDVVAIRYGRWHGFKQNDNLAICIKKTRATFTVECKNKTTTVFNVSDGRIRGSSKDRFSTSSWAFLPTKDQIQEIKEAHLIANSRHKICLMLDKIRDDLGNYDIEKLAQLYADLKPYAK